MQKSKLIRASYRMVKCMLHKHNIDKLSHAATQSTQLDVELKQLTMLFKEDFVDQLSSPTITDVDAFVLDVIERGRPPNKTSTLKRGRQIRVNHGGTGMEELKHVQKCGMSSEEIALRKWVVFPGPAFHGLVSDMQPFCRWRRHVGFNDTLCRSSR
jgi:hypothetical protein